jgi:hypothetical protein
MVRLFRGSCLGLLLGLGLGLGLIAVGPAAAENPTWIGMGTDPRLNDQGQAVWCDWNQIQLFQNGTVTTLTDNSNGFENQSPQINNAGDVVWSGTDGLTSEIFLYSGGSVAQLTANSPGFDNVNPQINNNGQVVWESWGGEHAEICLYSGGAIAQLTNNT